MIALVSPSPRSYSTDRNYFCQPYIGFVPETQGFKTVRKEMVRMSHKG